MLTCEELDIREDERNALLVVKEKLLNGYYRHVKNASWLKKELTKPGFNMSYSYVPTKYGVICCLGGYVAQEMGLKDEQEIHSYVVRTSSFAVSNSLYFPDDVESYSNITPNQTAQAIANFLKTGNPAWGSVVN